MALIIDAYNVLHCTHVLPSEYAMISATDLCRLLERSRWQGRDIAVVCDGVPKPTEGDYLGPVRLVYSGPGGDADSAIETMIDASDAPRDLTVVSNDRRVQRAARRRRARTMTSERFLHLLIKAAAPRPPADADAKPEQLGTTETWLEAFDIEPRTVEEIQRQVDGEDRAGRRAAPPPPTRPPEAPPPPTTTADDDDDDDGDRQIDKPKTETEYWLRQFGFGPDDEQQKPD